MKIIHTALASYGMSGTVFHGPLLEANPGFRISRILERNRNDSAGKHPGALIVRSYRELLADPHTELVVINTPDYLHHNMAIEALHAGKHIVVEKPFTLKAKEAEEIITLAERKNLMASVFHNRRWDGDFLTVRKVIEGQYLGRLTTFESHFDRFRNFIQDSWKEQSENGTGTLYNLGSHMIDQAIQLFGMPDFIFADVRAQRTNSTIDDGFDLFLHYPGVKCLVRGSYLVKDPGPRYILHGTEGSFMKYGIDPQEADLKAGAGPGGQHWGVDPEEMYGTLTLDKNGETERIPIPTIPGNYPAYYDNIHDHLTAGSPLAVTPRQALDVIRIIEAAYTSAIKGKTIRIN